MCGCVLKAVELSVQSHYSSGWAESYLLGKQGERTVCSDTEGRHGSKRKAWLMLYVFTLCSDGRLWC